MYPYFNQNNPKLHCKNKNSQNLKLKKLLADKQELSGLLKPSDCSSLLCFSEHTGSKWTNWVLDINQTVRTMFL